MSIFSILKHPHAWLFYGLLLPLWYFSIFVKYYLQVSQFNSYFVDGQNNLKCRACGPLNNEATALPQLFEEGSNIYYSGRTKSCSRGSLVIWRGLCFTHLSCVFLNLVLFFLPWLRFFSGNILSGEIYATRVHQISLKFGPQSGVSLSFCAGGQWGFSAGHF